MASAVFSDKVNQRKVSKSNTLLSAANNNNVVKQQDNSDNPRKIEKGNLWNVPIKELRMNWKLV